MMGFIWDWCLNDLSAAVKCVCMGILVGERWYWKLAVSFLI